ncbi:NUDIX domain-containing protein, partial [Chloroflexota bacterium]
MPDQKLYTLGFVFDTALEQVLLIHKKRPAWQAGQINGVGGKLEVGETPVQGVLREVWEESDLSISADRWTHTADMEAADWLVHVFAAVYGGPRTDARAKTDEVLTWVPVDALPADVISNLTWLIPLCLDCLRNGTP